MELRGRELNGNFAWSCDFHVNSGIFYMPQICNMGTTALLPIWRKVRWGFFRPEKSWWLRPGLNLRTWVLKGSTLPLDNWSRLCISVTYTVLHQSFGNILGHTHTHTEFASTRQLSLLDHPLFPFSPFVRRSTVQQNHFCTHCPSQYDQRWFLKHWFTHCSNHLMWLLGQGCSIACSHLQTQTNM